MRVRPAYVAAAVVVLLGLVGLVRGAGTLAAPAGTAAGAPSTPPGVSAGGISVSGAYARQTDRRAAEVYLSITNRSSQPDVLESISTGAAKKAELHDVPVQAGRRHQPTGPLTVPPGGTVTLSPGGGHIMLENPIHLEPGDHLSLVLTFSVAGQVLVEVPLLDVAPPGAGGTG